MAPIVPNMDSFPGPVSQAQVSHVAGEPQFEVGSSYLITAAQGTVNFCGYSGTSTPDLVAAFDTDFGG